MNVTYHQKLQRGRIDCERILNGLPEIYTVKEYTTREVKLIAAYRAKQVKKINGRDLAQP